MAISINTAKRTTALRQFFSFEVEKGTELDGNTIMKCSEIDVPGWFRSLMRPIQAL